VLSHDDARRTALAHPDAVELDHHGRPSFRVRAGGRIFATLWDATHMNVMLDEAGIRTAVAAHPSECAEVYWGRKLSAVRVDLTVAGEGLLAELLADAYEVKKSSPRRSRAADA
jgi:hypothetical protein